MFIEYNIVYTIFYFICTRAINRILSIAHKMRRCNGSGRVSLHILHLNISCKFLNNL